MLRIAWKVGVADFMKPRGSGERIGEGEKPNSTIPVICRCGRGMAAADPDPRRLRHTASVATGGVATPSVIRFRKADRKQRDVAASPLSAAGD